MNSTIDIKQYKTIVLKVGSSLVAPDKKACSVEYCLPLAHFIKKCHSQGINLILVSSGAVAAGYNQLKPNHQTLSLEQKQALAAVGQSMIINHWQRFFDRSVAQVLLSAEDIATPDRANNAKNTFRTLQQLNVMPIVNENDTVATKELRVGDNDNLAAQVASLVEADLLIICSDVDGFYSDNPVQNPNAKLIKQINNINAETLAMAKDSTNPQATGGMRTKIEAATLAASQQIDTIICNGKNESYMQLFNNQNPGTLISCQSSNITNQTYKGLKL